jgi:hypothetical protein
MTPHFRNTVSGTPTLADSATAVVRAQDTAGRTATATLVFIGKPPNERRLGVIASEMRIASVSDFSEPKVVGRQQQIPGVA